MLQSADYNSHWVAQSIQVRSVRSVAISWVLLKMASSSPTCVFVGTPCGCIPPIDSSGLLNALYHSPFCLFTFYFRVHFAPPGSVLVSVSPPLHRVTHSPLTWSMYASTIKWIWNLTLKIILKTARHEQKEGKRKVFKSSSN